MKFSPVGYIQGDVAINNGAEVASAHAVKVDQYSSYMASAYKNACPAQAVSCLTDIIDTVDPSYSDHGWADFMMWVPPFTQYIGFEFRAIGVGTLTISTPDDSENLNDIQVEVMNPPFSSLNGTEFSASGNAKSDYMELMEDSGQWFMNGPPMKKPDAANQDRAIICPFLRYPSELYVRVVAENDATTSRILYVLPFQFYFYPPDPTIALTDAASAS